MKWKANARKRSNTATALRNITGDSHSDFEKSPFRMSEGKYMVVRTHTRDFVEEDETGAKSVVSTMVFRKGDYFFPKAYLHPGKKIVGETKDARFTQRGWVVYLDAVLRDKSGNPVKVDGCEIDMSGWYLESELQDAELGTEVISLGSIAPSITDLVGRLARIRKAKELAQHA